ncbi:MAG: hypothetical protein ACO1OQ_12745 [Rufibacter sp.]
MAVVLSKLNGICFRPVFRKTSRKRKDNPSISYKDRWQFSQGKYNLPDFFCFNNIVHFVAILSRRQRQGAHFETKTSRFWIACHKRTSVAPMPTVFLKVIFSWEVVVASGLPRLKREMRFRPVFAETGRKRISMNSLMLVNRNQGKPPDFSTEE